jgi:hypothetical protein
MKAFCAAFMCLQFGFVIFWQKDFCAKAAHKMLVKFTPAKTYLAGFEIGQDLLVRRVINWMIRVCPILVTSFLFVIETTAEIS